MTEAEVAVSGLETGFRVTPRDDRRSSSIV